MPHVMALLQETSHTSAFTDWALEKSAQLSPGLHDHQAGAGSGLCCHSSHGDGKLH